MLDAGYTIKYKFLRDANFIGQEIVPAACGVPDGNGGYLREAIIGYNDTLLPLVCYGFCNGICPPNSQREITFKVDMSNTTIGPGGPHVIGNFNNYDVAATPMINAGNGIYYASVFVDTSQTIIYKFLKDSSLVDQEQVPTACDDANDWPPCSPVEMLCDVTILDDFLKDWGAVQKKLYAGEITQAEYFEWKIMWPDE